MPIGAGGCGASRHCIMGTGLGVLDLAADFFLVAAAAGCLYLFLAAYLVLTFRVQGKTQPLDPVPVTVLVPLCGAEPDLEVRLRALCRQDYSGPVQIICGVGSAADPAIDAVTAVAGECEDGRIDLQIDSRTYGCNLKISNLINMARHARHDTLVLVDSDIEVGPDFLADVVGELQKPGVGAVTNLYRGVAGSNVWSHFATAALNAHFLPDAIVALRLKLAQPCFGASIALTRKTLQQICGFQAFADQIWDDYAIGQAVRRLGLNVAIAPAAVVHLCCAQSGGELFASELRAARTARSIAPIGQAGRMVVYPFALSLIAALLGAGAPAAVLAVAALGARALMTRCFVRRFGGPTHSSVLLAFGELVVFAAFIAGWFGPDVIWRGNRYRLVSEIPAADSQ